MATRMVQSVTGQGACQLAGKVGDTVAGIPWSIEISGNAIVLDENPRNAPTDDTPFTGTLDGVQFSAAYTQPPGGPCQFRGGTLVGSFNSDFSAFQAIETVTWGSGEAAATMQNQWRGTRQ